MASRGRPPLPLGTWGEISTQRTTSGWIARVRFRDFDGRTRHVARTGKTKGAAKNSLTRHLTERTAPVDGAEITSESPILMVIERYYAHKVAHGKWATNTRRRYREIIDSYIGPHLGGLRVHEVTVGRLEVFLQSVTDDIGAPSAKMCKSVLSGTLKLAVRHGAIPANPVRETEAVEVQTKEILTVDLEQVAALRKVATERDSPEGKRGRPPFPFHAACVDTLLGTGVRIGEAFAILLEDLDLVEGSVVISGTVVRDDVTGKMVRQPRTKNGKTRKLFLPKFAIDTLAQYAAIVPPNDDGLLFPSVTGTVRDPNNFRKVWRKMIADAGLPTGTSPHVLRKTVGTAIDAQVNLRAAASQLGNDERTARKYYIRESHDGPAVADLLQGLVIPGMRLVENSA